MGYVTELKASGSNPDDPVNIVSKQSYVEMDRHRIKVYLNNDKVSLRKQVELNQINRVIYPISFNQPDNKIDCIQMDYDEKKKTQITKLEGDMSVKEPLTDDNVITLCFKSDEQMKSWETAIYSFRNDCDKQDQIED